MESLIGPEIDVFGTKFFPMLGPERHLDRLASGQSLLRHQLGPRGELRHLPGKRRPGEWLPAGRAVQPSHRRAGGSSAGTGSWAHGNWAAVDESQAVDVVCGPGTVVFFSANLLHGAHRNLTGGTSYRTAWHYIPGDLDLEMFPRGGYRDRHIVREAAPQPANAEARGLAQSRKGRLEKQMQISHKGTRHKEVDEATVLAKTRLMV